MYLLATNAGRKLCKKGLISVQYAKNSVQNIQSCTYEFTQIIFKFLRTNVRYVLLRKVLLKHHLRFHHLPFFLVLLLFYHLLYLLGYSTICSYQAFLKICPWFHRLFQLNHEGCFPFFHPVSPTVFNLLSPFKLNHQAQQNHRFLKQLQ